MNKQDPGSGSLTPSLGPMKRKRGRPRKEKSAVPGENVTVMPTSDHVMNINETTVQTDDFDDVKVGHAFTGVIEGTFSAGYLLNVQLAGSETCLRGVAFHSGHISPITAEAILNQQAPIYSSVPSLGQGNEQLVEPESQIPSSDNQHESHTAFVMSELKCGKIVKKDETSHELDAVRKFYGGGPEKELQPKFLFPDEEIPTGQQAAYIHNLMEKTYNDPKKTMYEFDTSRHVLETSADGGATKDEPTLVSIKFAPINLFCDEEPNECFQDDVNETLDEPDASRKVKEQSSDDPIPIILSENLFHHEKITTEQPLPFVPKMHEVVYDGPNAIFIELNGPGQVTEPNAVGGGSTEDSEKNVELKQTPAYAEPESMPSEEIPDSLFKIQYKRRRLASRTSGKVQTSNSAGRPSNDASNLAVAGSDSALKTSYPSTMLEEEVITSGSGANTKVNVIQPNESLVDSVKPDVQIGSDNA